MTRSDVSVLDLSNPRVEMKVRTAMLEVIKASPFMHARVNIVIMKKMVAVKFEYWGQKLGS